VPIETGVSGDWL